MMFAENVRVRIRFTSGSPFKSGAMTINIEKGNVHAEIVGPNRGTFPYTLTCTEPTCVAGADPPEMIVD